ncbi:hypothetical protein AA103587_1457 [Gluconobacter kanchanaburiensis NBRC 103587]|nr:hypothetical protein AA103587_1457 [Gluconobacter kanchanaburiensis NBRC 103587]
MPELLRTVLKDARQVWRKAHWQARSVTLRLRSAPHHGLAVTVRIFLQTRQNAGTYTGTGETVTV